MYTYKNLLDWSKGNIKGYDYSNHETPSAFSRTAAASPAAPLPMMSVFRVFIRNARR